MRWWRAFHWRQWALLRISPFLVSPFSPLFGYHIAGKILTPLVIAMFFVSVWLFYLQAFVIRQFCQYCLVSAAITTCLLVIVLSLRWFRPAAQ